MKQKIQFKSYTREKLEALLRRIELNHPARMEIESYLRSIKSGDWGERSLDYYTSFLNMKDYVICQGLRLLSSNNYHFQIDTLLLHSNFILILEVKNMAGTLKFDTRYNQLIQEVGDREEVYKDPIQQVNHQHYQFSRWLEDFRFPANIPIHSYVIVANDRAKIVPKNNEEILSHKVLRTTKLLDCIHKHQSTHKKEILSTKQLKKITKLFIKHHKPANPDLLKKYNIRKQDLLTGVHCPQCTSLPMKRVHGKWVCTDCNSSSKSAHLNALQDYFLLINPTITNQQVRDFLHINNVAGANYVLQQLHLPHQGTTSNRAYLLESLDLGQPTKRT
ncbi:nuclease-related domain-containing protein [Pseudalkalibacillus sp. Hm43]|uniref:nuclease-related domain-containing protein n=1 Tax=Pseudalkalibacillus sp. Hm43 TaxID=3450742 RepID=UPI003F43C3B6